ncbi:MAG: lytic transglycosylase domain-containing protein [Desulfobacterales bacterium]
MIKTEMFENRSFNTLTLWFICGMALLYGALFPPVNASKHLNLPEVSTAPHYPPIPSLFPERLIAFDPFRVPLKIQQIKRRFFLQPVRPAAKTVSTPRLAPAKVQRRLPQFKHEHTFQPLIAAASARYNVDTAMIKAIIRAESGYNPQALSPAGAGGLMQLMPLTAESLGVEDIFDPAQNINAGVRYFKKLMKIFKYDVSLALAAYNAGIQRVYEYNGVPPFTTTQIYVKKVLEYHQYYSNQASREERPSRDSSEG